MMALGVVVGAITGLIVNRIHTNDFLRPNPESKISNMISDLAASIDCCSQNAATPLQHRAINLQGLFWTWLIVPTVAIAFAMSFQIDVNEVLKIQRARLNGSVQYSLL